VTGRQRLARGGTGYILGWDCFNSLNYGVKYSFFPPSFVPGRAFLAHVPIAAIPIAETNAVRPVGVLIRS